MKAMLYTTDQQHSLLESYNNNSNQVQEKISFGTFVAGRHFTIRFYCLLSIFSLLILSQVFSMQSLGEHAVVPGWKPSYEWGLHCCLPMSAEIRQFNLFKDPLWRQDSRDLQKNISTPHDTVGQQVSSGASSDSDHLAKAQKRPWHTTMISGAWVNETTILQYCLSDFSWILWAILP